VSWEVRARLFRAVKLSQEGQHLGADLGWMAHVGGVRAAFDDREPRRSGEPVAQFLRLGERDGSIGAAVHDQRRAVDLAEAPGDVVAIRQAAERGGDLLDVGRGPFGVLVVPLPRAQDVDQTTSWTGPGPCSRNPNRAAPQLMSNSRPVGSMRGSFRLRSASKSIVLPAGAGAPWLAVLGGMCGLAGK
jgi:hypothetical protein